MHTQCMHICVCVCVHIQTSSYPCARAAPTHPHESITKTAFIQVLAAQNKKMRGEKEKEPGVAGPAMVVFESEYRLHPKVEGRTVCRNGIDVDALYEKK